MDKPKTTRGLTKTEAAKLIGVSYPTVLELIKRAKLEARPGYGQAGKVGLVLPESEVRKLRNFILPKGPKPKAFNGRKEARQAKTLDR